MFRNKMDPRVKLKFDSYPKDVALQLNRLRELIFRTAKEEGIDNLTETLKWGEPSYLSNIGSTIRIDWKEKSPQQFCIYFNCNTTLVETFRELYGDVFSYEGNRAIIFKSGEDLPIKELSQCLSMSLRYKKIKHLELLGA
jgi:hypothetical protein